MKTITTRKLKYMPYAQAQVKLYEDVIILQSYATDVIIIDNGIMQVTGLYSMTSRKHISAFMREYYPQYGFKLCKECVEKDMIYDLTNDKPVLTL